MKLYMEMSEKDVYEAIRDWVRKETGDEVDNIQFKVEIESYKVRGATIMKEVM